MSKQIIAIDSDLLVYQIGYAAQQSVDFGDPDQPWATPFADTDLAVSMLNREVEKYRDKFGKKAKIVFCLSDPKDNFRKDVLPTYKGNRKNGISRPLLFNFIRGWVEENTESYWEPTLEADDLLGILATQKGAIMVTVDKDMDTIPGVRVNPKDWARTEQTVESADRFFYFQTLTGDAVDNYKGCPGVGPVGANKILDAECSWAAVVAAFEKKGLTEADALQQARVARILRDEDYVNGEVVLWTPEEVAA
jgi:DNA polymerase-1